MRFHMHRLLLPLGVERAVYLDSDTLVLHELAPFFDAVGGGGTPGAAYAAAHVDAAQRYWAEQEFPSSTLPHLRRFRFASLANQTYNDGVLSFNLRRWCELDGVGRMLHVAHSHAYVAALWAKPSDQPLLEVAGAEQLARLVPSAFNCQCVSAHPPGSLMKAVLLPRLERRPAQWLPPPAGSGSSSSETPQRA